MAAKKDVSNRVKYSFWKLDVLPIESASDIHPHTSFTDGKIDLVESIEEAYRNNLYEKGAIEHGNPVDEDIEHYTSFLASLNDEEEPYTSTAIYPQKFQSIREILQEAEGGTSLTDADQEKLREDIDNLKGIDAENQSPVQRPQLGLNYSLVVPHGIELDYNPAIETADSYEEVVDSYEDAIIDFLREAESLRSGYNYVLLSSHYVNTPFEPRYVKKDELFSDMEHEKLGEVLETYQEKEILKIESLSSKLEEMVIPEVSEELMDQEELRELREFLYSPESVYPEKKFSESWNVSLPSLNIERPGVLAVGAHPTLIERNEKFMDYFRKNQGLTTKEELRDDLDERMDADISKQDVDGFLGDEAEEALYPDRELKKFYEPILEAARAEENFIFEINGKGVERQHKSVFWSMVDENLFGSDSHRPGEQPSRTEEFVGQGYSQETVLLTEKWLSKLDREIDRTKDNPQ